MHILYVIKHTRHSCLGLGTIYPVLPNGTIPIIPIIPLSPSSPSSPSIPQPHTEAYRLITPSPCPALAPSLHLLSAAKTSWARRSTSTRTASTYPTPIPIPLSLLDEKNVLSLSASMTPKSIHHLILLQSLAGSCRSESRH